MRNRSVRPAGLLAACAAAILISGAEMRAYASEAQEAKQETQARSHQEPSTLAISFPWQWLAASGGTMTFQCDAKKPADDDGIKMIEAVSRDGRRARYTGKGEDGGTFTGTRKGDDFTFEAVSKDGSKLVLQMPWSAARCLFGGARLAGAGSIVLRARDIGGRLRLEVAGQEKGVSVEVK
jgi:hypothetical protein